ncbi:MULTISPECIES: hypothetical protein [unclassified Micromonospora]|uniref:hypothetical protein n=1 Tax=unclassified Micromonospora TaxID=2617518 RepID=UPI0022B6776A|nr:MULTISPECIES: hypothetical protein [unclassified Micromonospora]MCZ7421654.1 hypothetical protein [Verrucosispora sp. WMMA2121]WBB93667.1 hypothetical protein O7597_12180 [Verrucosispora sp. WMMC514]
MFMSRAQLDKDTDTVWAYATGAVTSAPVLMAPLAVGTAAWAGGRSQRRGARHAWLLAGRDPAQAPLVEAGVLVACATVAYALVAAVTLLSTANAATWGGPFWWWLASAGIGFAATVAIAYGVGVLLPGPFTPFAAALVTYLATTWNLGQYGTWYALFPFTIELIPPFSAPHTPTMRGQLLWFTGLGFLALALVAAKVRSSTRVVIPAIGASLALALSGAATVIGENGRYVDVNRHIIWSCSGSSPEVCIHPAFATSLTPISQRAQAISQRLAPTPFAISRVEQRPRGVGGQPTPGAIAYALDAPATHHYDRASLDIAIAALGVDSCGHGPQRDRTAHAMAQLLVAWAVGDENLFTPRDPGHRQAKARFLNLSMTGQQQWLTAHANAVRTCSLTPQSFT